MRVLITRPRADAEVLAASLHAMGHTAFIEPMIDVKFTDGPDIDLKGVQALLLTSANGVRAAARRARDRTIAALAVGPATAAEARAQGFMSVRQSDGEGVDALATFARASLKPADGALVHVTGSISAGDLKAALAPSGFTVRIERLYEATAAEALSGALAAELTAGQLDAAMFFSPRTAQIFATLARSSGLETTCAVVDALALSKPVADALAPLAFRRIRIAAHANAAAMLDLLGPA